MFFVLCLCVVCVLYLMCCMCVAAGASRTRLDLIKVVAMSVNQDLKSNADDAYKDMNDWLGARFLKEMERYLQ